MSVASLPPALPPDLEPVQFVWINVGDSLTLYNAGVDNPAAFEHDDLIKAPRVVTLSAHWMLGTLDNYKTGETSNTSDPVFQLLMHVNWPEPPEFARCLEAFRTARGGPHIDVVPAQDVLPTLARHVLERRIPGAEKGAYVPCATYVKGAVPGLGLQLLRLFAAECRQERLLEDAILGDWVFGQ